MIRKFLAHYGYYRLPLEEELHFLGLWVGHTNRSWREGRPFVDFDNFKAQLCRVIIEMETR